MSASLVGSEMCIRDSLHHLVRGAERARASVQVRGQRQGREHREGHGGPVSYTHLTLPTICSV
eukprot:952297-Alexandrium_andersonii.AAC.1